MHGVTESISEISTNPFFAAAREQYDPEYQATPQQLGVFLLEHYELEQASPTSPVLTGAIAADMLAGGVRTATGLCLAARNSRERQWVERGITATVAQTAARASEVLDDIPDEWPASRRALGAADRIAWSAHGHTRRKSGKNAYQHPTESAAIALAGLEAVEDDGWSIDQHVKEETVIATWLHDTVEDTVRQTSLDPTRKLTGVSPYLVQRTLRLAGVDYGAQVAHTLRAITRTAGGLPPIAKIWRRSYQSYALYGRTDVGFCLAKQADSIHNSQFDPKPTPTTEAHIHWQSKLTDYARLGDAIREQAEERAGLPGWPSWLPLYMDAVAATTPNELPQYLDRLENFVGQPFAVERYGEQQAA